MQERKFIINGGMRIVYQECESIISSKEFYTWPMPDEERDVEAPDVEGQGELMMTVSESRAFEPALGGQDEMGRQLDKQPT